MNKKILIIGGIVLAVLIIVLIIVLSSGGKKDDGTNTPSNTITLQYWGLWEPEAVMKPLITKFENANPGIKIQYTQKTFTQYEQNVFTRIEQGATAQTPAPDIFRMNNTWLPKFQKYLYPMPASIMSTQQFSDTFYPTAVSDLTGNDGKIYAMPLEIDGLVLFYNKKMLKDAGYDTPPTDWDTFIEAAKKMTKTDGSGKITTAGAALGSAKNIKHSVDIMNLIFLQNNVEILNSAQDTVTLNTTRGQTAITFYSDFTNKHKTWSSDLRSDLEMFYSGNLAMFFGPSWRAFDIIQSAPSLEFGMAKVPQIPNNPEVNYAMYWAEAVSKRSEHPAEAWKFIKFLSENTQQKQFFQSSMENGMRAFGEPYSRVDLKTEISGNPYLSAIADMAPTMKAWKMGDQTAIEEILRTMINSVTDNGVNAQTALKDAEDAINTKIAEYSN